MKIGENGKERELVQKFPYVKSRSRINNNNKQNRRTLLMKECKRIFQK